MTAESPDKPRDCSSCRHHTQVSREPVTPGSIEDSVEDTLVNFEDARPYYFCQATKSPHRGEVGFEPVSCEAYEAPRARAAETDAIMARYDARMAKRAREEEGGKEEEEEEEASADPFSKEERALVDAAFEHVGKYAGTIQASRAKNRGLRGVVFVSSVTGASSGELSWQQLRSNSAEMAGALIVACFERRW